LSILSDFKKEKKKNKVLLMAGGLGMRLRPLTENCPKPLLRIGDKPILQIIMESFVKEGFLDFYISVNYKSEMIEEYFGNGEHFGVNISYIHEPKRLGTAGAVGLIPDVIDEPIIVMNGDLLTNVNFSQLLAFHNNNNAVATMCGREYKIQVPFGVINYDNWEIKSLEEKPMLTNFVNAGIYVLNPDVVKAVKKDEYLDMPDLFTQLISENKKVLVFPLRESWLDIGRMEDFERARQEFV
ncbi:MAG: alcohol dehydrogenase, partial [Selenomonadales bacterium]|nr:alcohol dehydrogenase [Selenomonadales bacterium]